MDMFLLYFFIIYWWFYLFTLPGLPSAIPPPPSTSSLPLWGCSPTHLPTPPFLLWHSPTLWHRTPTGPGATPPTDVQQGYDLVGPLCSYNNKHFSLCFNSLPISFPEQPTHRDESFLQFKWKYEEQTPFNKILCLSSVPWKKNTCSLRINLWLKKQTETKTVPLYLGNSILILGQRSLWNFP